MDAKSRRQAVLLAVLLAVLAVVAWWNLSPAPPGAVPQTARSPGTAPRSQDVAPVPAVRLDRLAAARPEPAPAGRDPFRFGGGSRMSDPAPQASGQRPDVAPTSAAAGPPMPQGPPPIPLRYIGVVRVPQGQRLVAVLSDGVGVYRGTEGDIIEGRYRIVRVGLESVELAYVDGRGHQVIRLSGS